MIKKIILFLIVMFVFSGFVFSQEEDAAHNTISVHFGLVGIEGSYEYQFNRHFSVLGSASASTMIFMWDWALSGKGRVYPFGKAFYLEMGLGYVHMKGASAGMAELVLNALTFGLYYAIAGTPEELQAKSGLLIQPGLGWKIDIGKPGGFVLPISMGIDIRATPSKDFLPYFRIGLGYSF